MQLMRKFAGSVRTSIGATGLVIILFSGLMSAGPSPEASTRPVPDKAISRDAPVLRTSQIYTAQATAGLAGEGDREVPVVNPIDHSDLALLSDPDTSSPRATLNTLLESVGAAYSALMEAYDEHRTSPGFAVSPSVAEKVVRARLLLRRAVATLDLSSVPSVNREKTGIETVLLLKEVFDRLPEVDPETVPGRAEVFREKNPVTSWTVPYSDIDIVKITEGPNAGEFRLSSASVAGARSFYDVVDEFAERNDANNDFFEFYTLTPGDLLPPKWYLWIEELPDWTRLSILDQALWQWIGMVVVVAALFGAYWATWRLTRGSRPSDQSRLRRGGRALFLAIMLAAVALVARWLISEQLNITGWVFTIANTMLHVIAYLATAWAAYVLAVAAAEWIVSSPRFEPGSIDSSLFRIASRLVGIAAGIAIIFYGATQIGISLYGVIAGLGVGGLALGLAARPTLENLIGGLILYADRPVRVGDFCQFGDKTGTVEEIGLRSTRIRGLDRTLITISNAEFSNMPLINFSRRDQIMMKTEIGLRYETTQAQMRQVLDRIRFLLKEHGEIAPESVRVRFRELGVYALKVEIYAYVRTTDFSHFLEVQEGIYLKLMEIVEESGTAMAFPSTTTYHVVDGDHDPATRLAKIAKEFPMARPA